MKIYDFPLSPNCRKVRAVVYELGLLPEFVPLNLFKGEQRAPAIVQLNPNAKAPILVDGDFVLWESNAIVAYLANGTHLLPSLPRERADVQRWCDWQLAHMGPAIGKVAFQRLVKPMTGQGAPDAGIVSEGTLEYARFVAVLETMLGDKEWVASRLSIADFVLASVFSIAETVGLVSEPYPRVRAWLTRILARESMQRAIRESEPQAAE